LHNLSIVIDHDLPEDEMQQVEEEVPVDPPRWQPAEGLAMRRALIERLFNDNNNNNKFVCIFVCLYLIYPIKIN
jgi:hypothetical protein